MHFHTTSDDSHNQDSVFSNTTKYVDHSEGPVKPVKSQSVKKEVKYLTLLSSGIASFHFFQVQSNYDICNYFSPSLSLLHTHNLAVYSLIPCLSLLSSPLLHISAHSHSFTGADSLLVTHSVELSANQVHQSLKTHH